MTAWIRGKRGYYQLSEISGPTSKVLKNQFYEPSWSKNATIWAPITSIIMAMDKNTSNFQKPTHSQWYSKNPHWLVLEDARQSNQLLKTGK